MFDPFKIDGDDELDFSNENLVDALSLDLLDDSDDDSFMYDDEEDEDE